MRAAALALLLAVAPDDFKKTDVVCPIDGTKFTAHEVVRTDAQWAWGGEDADFCRHAFSTLPMEHYVWTCPTCYYSGGKDRFDPKQPAPEDLKRKIKGALKPEAPIAAGATQEKIPGWVKYDLFAQVETLRGASSLEIAKRHLGAAWAARQAGAVRLHDYDDWVDAAKSAGLHKSVIDLGKKNRSDEDLAACRKLEQDVAAGKFKGTPLLLNRYLLAVTFRRRGENVDALKWLDEVDKLKGENSIVDGAAKTVRESIDAERSQQRKAAALLAKAVENPAMEAEQKAESLYILGEIARRLGETKEAPEWYDKAIAATKNADLKRRAETQKKLVK